MVNETCARLSTSGAMEVYGTAGSESQAASPTIIHGPLHTLLLYLWVSGRSVEGPRRCCHPYPFRHGRRLAGGKACSAREVKRQSEPGNADVDSVTVTATRRARWPCLARGGRSNSRCSLQAHSHIRFNTHFFLPTRTLAFFFFHTLLDACHPRLDSFFASKAPFRPSKLFQNHLDTHLSTASLPPTITAPLALRFLAFLAQCRCRRAPYTLQWRGVEELHIRRSSAFRSRFDWLDCYNSSKPPAEFRRSQHRRH